MFGAAMRHATFGKQMPDLRNFQNLILTSVWAATSVRRNRLCGCLVQVPRASEKRSRPGRPDMRAGGWSWQQVARYGKSDSGSRDARRRNGLIRSERVGAQTGLLRSPFSFQPPANPANHDRQPHPGAKR